MDLETAKKLVLEEEQKKQEKLSLYWKEFEALNKKHGCSMALDHNSTFSNPKIVPVIID